MERRTGGTVVRTLAGVVLGAVAAVLWTSPAKAAWDGTQDIRLGDTAAAEFQGDPGTELHQYRFYAPEEARVSALIRKRNGLSTHVDLIDAGQMDVDTGASDRPTGVAGFTVPSSGFYAFEVSATSGSGTYRMRTQVRYRTVRREVLTDTLTFDFGAAAGTVVDVTVRPARGSGADPVITDVDGPLGPVGGIPESSRLSRLQIPADGTYTVTVRNDGTEGAPIDLLARFRPVRGGRLWSFGTVDAPRGTPTRHRADWLGSAHADLSAEAFRHWDTESPSEIPTSCARCHSGGGYEDYIGSDGSTPWVVDKPQPAGARTVDCQACHNDVTLHLTEVTFPSGRKVTGLGDESRCMVCHQGRESTKSLDATIASKNPATDDTVVASYSFRNVHYFAAAATLWGREAEGAYEYADPEKAEEDPDPVTGLPLRKAYDGKFQHVASRDVCQECHDQHSLEVRIEACASCHVAADGLPVENVDDLKDVRMAGTINDFDGDGNTTEGVYFEMHGMADRLYDAIRIYARGPAGRPIVYDPHTHPYFFPDFDDDGVADEADLAAAKYVNWTPRLLRAAYNYQYFQKDPGAFAHNAKYMLEILYDSIEDLNRTIEVPDFETLVRNDSGHFDSSAEAYRHWDEDEAVSASCSRCHSPDGFQFRIKYGIDPTVPQPLSSAMNCESCHAVGANFSPLGGNVPERNYVASVQFPYPTTATSTQITAVTITNAAADSPDRDDSYICMTCHRGRQSTLTVDATIAASPTSKKLSTPSVHYYPAGAVQYGARAAVGYQYAGRLYSSRWDHTAGYAADLKLPMDPSGRCAFCHMQEGSHSFQPKFTPTCAEYAACHSDVTDGDLLKIRKNRPDYDGDPATERLTDEVAAFAARLELAIQDYGGYFTEKVDGVDVTTAREIAYLDGRWYVDENLNLIVDAEETKRATFDAKGARATYNHGVWRVDPGAWAHNTNYILQLLYDSIEDLNPGMTEGLTRPPLGQ